MNNLSHVIAAAARKDRGLAVIIVNWDPLFNSDFSQFIDLLYTNQSE